MSVKEIICGLSAFFPYISSGKIPVLEKICVIGLVFVYFIFPIDVIPDVIPVVGWLDDIGVGALFMAYCAWRVKHIQEKGQESSTIDIDDKTPKLPEHSSALTVQHKASASEAFFTRKKR